MAETSKNVVLFDSLEDISGNAWTGKLGSLDLSDAKAKNLSVKVYGNAKNIDSIKYVQDNIIATRCVSKAHIGTDAHNLISAIIRCTIIDATQPVDLFHIGFCLANISRRA